MSGDTVQHLADVLDSRKPVDNTEVFNYLLNVREQAWTMVNEGLNLRRDMKCADIPGMHTNGNKDTPPF